MPNLSASYLTLKICIISCPLFDSENLHYKLLYLENFFKVAEDAMEFFFKVVEDAMKNFVKVAEDAMENFVKDRFLMGFRWVPGWFLMDL